MKGMVDAFWRAAAYCLHPRVVLWSVAPMLIAALLVGGLAWWQGDAMVAALRATLEGWPWMQALLGWLEGFGLGAVGEWIAPVLLLALAVPLMVVLALALVAMLMTPAIVGLVARRRFPALQRREGAAWWQVWAWSLVSVVAALAVLVLSLPLWLLPPVALVLPPLVWGWLTYRVFAYEVLSAHASAGERRRILATHRSTLLAMGVIAGFMGAVPTLVWAVGAATLVLAPLLLVVSVWLYTLVFAFAAAWFAHFALAELQALRDAEAAAVPPAAPQPELLEAADAADGVDTADLPRLPPAAGSPTGAWAAGSAAVAGAGDAPALGGPAGWPDGNRDAPPAADGDAPARH